MPQDYNISDDISNKCPCDGAVLQKDLLEPSIFVSILPIIQSQALACYIFCSRFPFSHLDLAAESTAKSCWSRWSVFQGSHAQRGSRKGAKHTWYLHPAWKEVLMAGKVDCPWYIFIITFHLLALLNPATTPHPQYKIDTFSLQVFLPNVESFFSGFYDSIF